MVSACFSVLVSWVNTMFLNKQIWIVWTPKTKPVNKISTALYYQDADVDTQLNSCYHYGTTKMLKCMHAQSVSYTHLDVYKRQDMFFSILNKSCSNVNI